MLSGKELKLKRVELDIQAKQIADVLGVSKPFVTNMEKGIKKIPVDKYIVWTEFLGIHK